jgi:hypothetical protein
MNIFIRFIWPRTFSHEYKKFTFRTFSTQCSLLLRLLRTTKAINSFVVANKLHAYIYIYIYIYNSTTFHAPPPAAHSSQCLDESSSSSPTDSATPLWTVAYNYLYILRSHEFPATDGSGCWIRLIRKGVAAAAPQIH